MNYKEIECRTISKDELIKVIESILEKRNINTLPTFQMLKAITGYEGMENVFMELLDDSFGSCITITLIDGNIITLYKNDIKCFNDKDHSFFYSVNDEYICLHCGLHQKLYNDEKLYFGYLDDLKAFPSNLSKKDIENELKDPIYESKIRRIKSILYEEFGDKKIKICNQSYENVNDAIDKLREKYIIEPKFSLYNHTNTNIFILELSNWGGSIETTIYLND